VANDPGGQHNQAEDLICTLGFHFLNAKFGPKNAFGYRTDFLKPKFGAKKRNFASTH
jgi:hypothetical protein